MLDDLLTEQRNPASEGIDALPAAEILRIIHEEDLGVAAAITPELPRIAAAVDAIVERLSRGGRLFYIGAGTSGRLGVLDASECRPTFQVPEAMVQGVMAGGERALAHATEASEDDAEAGARDLALRGFNGSDVLVGISASGRTPYVIGALNAARGMGAFTTGISCTTHPELAAHADISIALLTGPEIIAGSTRMKAGTATKLVLNMISTATMIRLGFVYGNLMVNVQPTNEKLKARARRILSQATGLDAPAATRLLEDAGGDVRTAIVMKERAMTRSEAEQQLEAAGGRVSAAVREPMNG